MSLPNGVDVPALSSRAGVSVEAAQLLADSEVVDLHLESYIPPRIWGYDLQKPHRKGGPLGGRFFGHLDFPRALEGGLTGGMWSISTNPARTQKGRLDWIGENVRGLRSALEKTNGRMRVAKTWTDYQAIRADGAHGALLAVQGGNAFEADIEAAGTIEDGIITRVTVVHLSNSCFGATSSPLSLGKGNAGLTDKGRDFIQALNQHRVFVDLAHINVAGFWDVVEVHDKTQPLIVTHTGVDGVKDMWRNISDKQIRAVVDTGGVIGIIFQGGFLKRKGGPKDGRMVIEHIEHVINVAGEQSVALGSDYDGAIIPPKDLRDGSVGYVRLVSYMLKAGWSEERIRGVLGTNFLQSFARLRP